MPRAPTQKSKADLVPTRSLVTSTKRKARRRPKSEPMDTLQPSNEFEHDYKNFVPRNKWEEYWCEYMGVEETVRMQPSDERLRTHMFDLGYTKKTLEEGLRIYHASMDELMERGEKPKAWGFKPRHARMCSIQVIDLPGSEPLVIRLFDGDMESFGQFCLDFYNLETEAAVNTPSGWVINVEPEPGSMTMLCGGAMSSWEQNHGMSRGQIPAGEERFSIVEGAVCHLERPGMDSFWFKIPRRKRQLPPDV
ncbi:hypothetical protein CONPUDRAFT_159409 [Coniophora puteana RWD-64-598 SS2]|uniref:Uncharacterized protein n=1 Tax=Coniophora puteana (strain RWD-64-598) TaxID=741705 RepID=A0A5M3M8W7_CONPW|nr:uncharacterized protein CONPUDRAFT_159409 [Coniophora puteana RWD-64-598 SS2]EIW75284.1 hypothetical protein CONPUDRAFT_159409 [Coniophora puteana RWD-64-598 SS2]